MNNFDTPFRTTRENSTGDCLQLSFACWTESGTSSRMHLVLLIMCGVWAQLEVKSPVSPLTCIIHHVNVSLGTAYVMHHNIIVVYVFTMKVQQHGRSALRQRHGLFDVNVAVSRDTTSATPARR